MNPSKEQVKLLKIALKVGTGDIKAAPGPFLTMRVCFKATSSELQEIRVPRSTQALYVSYASLISEYEFTCRKERDLCNAKNQ